MERQSFLLQFVYVQWSEHFQFLGLFELNTEILIFLINICFIIIISIFGIMLNCGIIVAWFVGIPRIEMMGRGNFIFC